MGNGQSEDINSVAAEFYNRANTCILPDVGIDHSLLQFGGLQSNTALTDYSNKLAAKFPTQIRNAGSAATFLQPIPHAVGMGALVISLLMEIAIGLSPTTKTSTINLIRRVFGEEKASAVRDTMDEYLRRHQEYISNDQEIIKEIRRMETELSSQLTRLKNSLLNDGQMNSNAFKIWVNGATFHIEMLIHAERLSVQRAGHVSEFDIIHSTISWYIRELDTLLEKFKEYKTRQTRFIAFDGSRCIIACHKDACIVSNDETRCKIDYRPSNVCSHSELRDKYLNLIFTQYHPFVNIRQHLLNTMSNLNTLINQDTSFTLPADTRMIEPVNLWK